MPRIAIVKWSKCFALSAVRSLYSQNSNCQLVYISGSLPVQSVVQLELGNCQGVGFSSVPSLYGRF